MEKNSYDARTSNLKQKSLEEIAQKFSNYAPKETNFNNKRSSNYFSNKNDITLSSSSSTLKDDLTLIKGTINSKSNKGHKKSLSKALYIINNNAIISIGEVIVDKTFPKIESYKVPCKNIDESIDDIDFEEFTDISNKFEKIKDCTCDELIIANENKANDTCNIIEPIDKITDFQMINAINYQDMCELLYIYEALIKNFESFPLFLRKNKENFQLIQKWFDIVSVNPIIYELSTLNSEYNNSKLKHLNKNNKIQEVITYGTIIKLYDLVKNNNNVRDLIYFNIYGYMKSSINHFYNNFLILLFSLLQDTVSKTDNIFEILCRKKVLSNKYWLTKDTYITVLESNNNALNMWITQTVVKLTEILQTFKEKRKDIENNNGNDIISDLNNLEFMSYSLKNLGKIQYEDLRSFIHNDYVLGNLVKVNVLEKEEMESKNEPINDSDLDQQPETDDSNEAILLPFLPPIDKKKYKYTLVLDLDETLVHYIEECDEAFVQVRPYAEYFLIKLSKYFEIVIFTAATEEYADIVLNELDSKNSIAYKLYRKHTFPKDKVFIKDLSKLGRDLKKTIIIDNVKENFSLQPDNGLHISSFVGNENDCELRELIEDLIEIVTNNVDDVRFKLDFISNKMVQRYNNEQSNK